jgi:hypothetical protein
VLRRDVHVCAMDRALQLRPEALQRVHVPSTARVLAPAVMDRAMNEAALRQSCIGRQLIGAQCAAGADLLDDDRLERPAADVGNQAGEHIAGPFDDAEYDRLAGCAAATLPAASLATDVSFVGVNGPGQRVVAVGNRHVLADLVPHPPSGFIAHTELPLKFLGWHAVARRAEEIHRVEPGLKRRPGALERSADHGVNVMAAPRAGIGRHVSEPSEAAMLAALGAVEILTETHLHQVIETHIVIGEHLEEPMNGELSGHGRCPFLFPIWGSRG